ncbi:hypothetical protein HBI80_182070 [Parastagonospora nodorum]|nr:hypothetical protein HBI80_182070 [Parastagonospora nodorum]
MSDVTELRCWPSCIDALDWSQDGIIALASDERVELLFPNTISYDRDQEFAQWQHIPLQVPWFTNEELPIKRPAPLANYSLGEEISSSAPTAISWSPPGLAKHRRCALAALTANLVLSIWSAEGKLEEASSWDRRLIVNNALAEYFMGHAREEVSHVAATFNERMRLRTRVRAFTWAPALPNSHTSSTLGSRLSYGQHIIAVCNDDNHLALVAINSSTTSYAADPNWHAEVLTHVSVVPNSDSIFPAPSSFADRMKQQRQISHVSWSPWITRGDCHHAILLYATNEDVRARIVTYMHDSVGLGDEVVYPNIEMRYNGPMKWGPKINENILTVALFTSTGLICLTISTQDASIIEQASHDLDGRWDQVSGAVWEVDRNSTPRLHVSSILSTIQNPTAVLDSFPGTLVSAGCPSWRDQLENSASLFSAKNDLKGNVKMKVWGLAISPLGDFVATCHSVHPSDMIEYGSPADRRGTVAVTALQQYRQLREGFPAYNVNAEGVLLTLKKLVGNTVEDSNQMPAFVEEIADKLLQAYGPIENKGDSVDASISVDSGIKVAELLRYVKLISFFDPRTLRDRYVVLASQACNSGNNEDLQRMLIAYRLATNLQVLSDTLAETAFSIEIRDHHRQMIKLVQKLIEHEITPTQPAERRAPGAVEEQDGPISITTAQPLPTALMINLHAREAIVDACDFCSAPIPFVDLKTASCTNGHQFPRCGLSLVAIQAPGITKYCGICSTPFFNEEFVAAQEMQKLPRVAKRQGKETEGNSSIGHDIAGPQSNGDNTYRADAEGGIPAEDTALPKDPEQNMGTGCHKEAGREGPEDVMVEEERRQLPVTFAKLLFLACDACIYCGGKFVG